jgi:hypothetical protein
VAPDGIACVVVLEEALGKEDGETVCFEEHNELGIGKAPPLGISLGPEALACRDIVAFAGGGVGVSGGQSLLVRQQEAGSRVVLGSVEGGEVPVLGVRHAEFLFTAAGLAVSERNDWEIPSQHASLFLAGQGEPFRESRIFQRM